MIGKSVKYQSHVVWQHWGVKTMGPLCITRLLHERLSTVVRTDEAKTSAVAFLPLIASSFHKNCCRWKTRTRSGRGKMLRTWFANSRTRRLSVRAQERSVESKRFSSRKIDRNRNDARHVTRPGQWGRCILIHLPVPPAIQQFSGINGRICEFLRFWYGN